MKNISLFTFNIICTFCIQANPFNPGMEPVLFDSVGMNIFFSVLNLRLMKELKRYSYDHFLDILSVADIYQPNPFGDISTNVYNLLKSVVIEVITSQIKKRE